MGSSGRGCPAIPEEAGRGGRAGGLGRCGVRCWAGPGGLPEGGFPFLCGIGVEVIGCEGGRLVGESDMPRKLRFKTACGEDRKLTWETHGLSSSSYFYMGKLRPVESVQIARRLQNGGQPGLEPLS